MCKECQDTGWVRVERPEGTYSKRCDCPKGGLDTSRYASLRLPPRFASATHDNFDSGGMAKDENKYTVLTAALGKVHTFVNGFPLEASKGLLIHGGGRDDRTHLAVAALKLLADKGFSCLYIDYQHLLKIQFSRNEEDAGESEEISRLAASVDVLLIDRLGERRPTDWALDTISEIINHRYVHEKGLLATTGCPLASAQSAVDVGTQAMYASALAQDTLEQRLGRECAEMLGAICSTVPITVPTPDRPAVSGDHSVI